jgi:flagellar hook-associated protein 2
MSTSSLLSSLLSSQSSTSSSTSASTINLSSLLEAMDGSSAAGIDVNSAVEAAVYAAQAPEQEWQTEKTTLGQQTTDLTSLSTAVSQLETDLNALSDPMGVMNSLSLTSSQSSVVSGSATSGTIAGMHVITVNNLAQTASWYSAPVVGSSTVAAGDTPLSAGGFNIVAGGTTTAITVGSGVNTLNQVASDINNQNLGVTASVITDSTGAQLAIVSNNSGSANDFSITNAASDTMSLSDAQNSAITAGQTVTIGNNNYTFQTNSPSAAGQVQIGTDAAATLANLKAAVNGTDGINTSANTLAIAGTVNSTADTLTFMATTAGTGVGTGTNTVAATTTSATFTGGTFSVPSGSTSSADSYLGFTHLPGEDASLTVDGIPITSASNTVTGALNGITLNLAAPSTTPVSIVVAPNASSIGTAIQSFVTDYNSIVSGLNTQFTYNTTSGTSGDLSGDSVVRGLQQQLLTAMTYVEPGGGTESNLGALGISMGNDGTLTLDSSTLNSALTNNFSAVQNFFQGDALNGFAAQLGNQLSEYTDPSNGAFTLDLQSLSSESTELTTEINDFQTNYIVPLQTQLQAEFSSAEIALQSMPQQEAELNSELGNNSNSSSNG